MYEILTRFLSISNRGFIDYGECRTLNDLVKNSIELVHIKFPSFPRPGDFVMFIKKEFVVLCT